MKRTNALLLCCTLCLCAMAQRHTSERLHYQAGIGVSIPLPESQDNAKHLFAKVMYDLRPRLSAGLGTGISKYETELLPLYATLRWDMTTPHRFTPFVEGSIGYSYALTSSASGGSCMGLSLGASYRCRSSDEIFITVGYEHQHYSQQRSFDSSVIRARYVEENGYNAMRIAVGYQF